MTKEPRYSTMDDEVSLPFVWIMLELAFSRLIVPELIPMILLDCCYCALTPLIDWCESG